MEFWKLSFSHQKTLEEHDKTQFWPKMSIEAVKLRQRVVISPIVMLPEILVMSPEKKSQVARRNRY